MQSGRGRCKSATIKKVLQRQVAHPPDRMRAPVELGILLQHPENHLIVVREDDGAELQTQHTESNETLRPVTLAPSQTMGLHLDERKNR